MQLYLGEQWNLNGPLQTPGHGLPSNHFDLINSRFLVDGVDGGRWESLIAEYNALLKHKAWLQMAEVQWTFHSQSNHELPALNVWSDAYHDALRLMRKNPNVAAVELERHVRFAGFQQVDGKTYDIPVGEWRAGASNYTLLFASQ